MALLMTLFVRLATVFVSIALVSASTCVRAADHPGYSPTPTVTEYDVDPNWPKRPDNVSGEGWVSGIAIDANEHIWMFRKGPDPIQVYATDGTFVRTWGKALFVDPHQLRIDADGNVWVADFGQHIVQKFTPEGELLLTLGVRGESGEDESHFYRPTDMIVAPSGDVFVTDGYGNRRIVHLDKDGNFIKAWGSFGSEPGQFVLPHAIQIDSKGLLYVADRNSGRIQVFNQDGSFVDQWSNLIMPWGLSINSRDELWVCGSTPHWWYRKGAYQEYKDQVLMRFSTDGRVQQVWTLHLGEKKETLKPGETIGAHCIVQDAANNLYVGDIYGERAQKFIPINKPE